MKTTSVIFRTTVISGAENTELSPPIEAGLDPGSSPAIGYPHQFANDAIPVSNHRARMAGLILGSSPRTAMTGLDC